MADAEDEVPRDRLKSDFFNELINQSLRQLERDRLWMDLQVKRSFLSPAAVLTIAILIIIMGVWWMVHTRTVLQPTIIMSAGALVAMVAAVLFYFYERSVVRVS